MPRATIALNFITIAFRTAFQVCELAVATIFVITNQEGPLIISAFSRYLDNLGMTTALRTSAISFAVGEIVGPCL